LLLFLLLSLLAVLPAAPARAEPADIAAAGRSVVRVVLISDDQGQYALVGHGSGIAVAPDMILTNAHVVTAAQEYETVRIGIVPSQGKGGWFARIVAVSPQNDLALVQLTEPGALPPATLFTGPVADGEDVFAIGYPGNVDLAQGLGVGDMVMPTTPVKTRGNVSSGRSSRQFDTILHTAPIGSGNSGGPLLDACGRVIGVNSFGTRSDGSDSEFFFAVSMREVSRFLLQAKVRPQSTGLACRSLADLDRAESERLAGERQQTEADERASAAKEEAARRPAHLAVIAERENGMALAGVALLLALAAGGAAFAAHQRAQRRNAWIAGALGGLLLAGGALAWLSRPALSEIDGRAAAAVKGGSPAAPVLTSTGGLTGDLVCTFDPQRSRVTVSDPGELRLGWTRDGCVDGTAQYALTAEGWSRVEVPDGEDTVTVVRFDPGTGTRRADRHFLGIEDMTRLREERDRIKAPACGTGEAAARAFGADQARLAGLLTVPANERLVHACRRAGGG
jgi:hypothetical protein